MALNGVKRLFCFILPNLIALRAYYVTVVEDRLILSAEYRLPYFWPQLTNPAAWSLDDS